MRLLRTIYLLAAVSAAMTSCVNSDSTEVALYDDAAITAFSLTNNSSYKFSIDQLQRLIFNADSLPAGTDCSRMLCQVTALNNGLVLLRDTDGVSLRYYNSTDSIDFTQPRELLVYSSDGTARSIYTVKVNVHKEDGDQFRWQLVDSTWAEPQTDILSLPEGIAQFLGSSTGEQYAYGTDGHLKVLTAGSSTWEDTPVGADSVWLPTEDIALTSYAMTYSDSTDYVLMVGNRSSAQYPEDETTMVWRRLADYSNYGKGSGRWVYVKRNANEPYRLPRMSGLTMAKYDDGVLLTGKPYTTIYQSRDNGITWKENSLYTMPDGFDPAATKVRMTVDADNFLWLYCSGTGQVWRGRLNRLGWGK